MPAIAFDDPGTECRYWVRRLLDESPEPSPEVIREIERLRPLTELVAYLASSEPRERDVATRALWVLWLHEAGTAAAAVIARGTTAMDRRNHEEAIRLFTGLIEQYPDFAEAYNKRATARYLARCYDDAIADCLEVLRRNPAHFGAWHGLGLCYLRQGRYAEAAWAFRHAQAIQPYAEVNRELAEQCEAHAKDFTGWTG